MIEDEATTKWCPFVRVVERIIKDDISFGNSFPRNRVAFVEGDNYTTHSNKLVGCHCIGSQCIAWRIYEKARPANTEKKYIEWRDGEEKPSTQFEESGWVLTDSGTEPADKDDCYILHWEKYERVGKHACPAKGYCVLAGKP